MPARTCKPCTLEFPLRTEFEHCPVCLMRTELQLMKPKPDSSWETKLNEAMSEVAETGDEEQRIIANRTQRFRMLGYDWDVATALAQRWCVGAEDYADVHKIEHMISVGCDLETARRIA